MQQLGSLKLILVLGPVLMASVTGGLMKVSRSSLDLPSITVNIIKTCYGESVNEIGLAGNQSDAFIAAVASDDPIAVVLLNGNKRSEHSGAVAKRTRQLLQLFAVTASSSMELERIFLDLRNSRWWNHMAQFYIFSSSGNEARCSEAFGFLWTAWKLDVLGAKFICNDDADGPLIYTFNPYTGYAPKPWALEKIHRGINDHPWALFVRKYRGKTDNCENVDFDPTRKLGHYEVRLTLSRDYVLSNFTETGRITRGKHSNAILQKLSQYMEVTLKMVFCEKEPFGEIDQEGRGHGRLRYLTEGLSDLVLLPVPLGTVPELPGTYPFLYQKMFSVSQYTAYLSQWQKLVSVIDKSSRMFLCLVILMNVVSLKYLLGQSLTTSVLNTIRIICNSSFTSLPRGFGARIYLASLFCFVLVIQALYQGQLSALLAKQVRLPNIDNYRDLESSHHSIYGWHHHKAILSAPALQERFVGIDIFKKKCLEFVALNASIACVGAREGLINDTIDLQLHMSKQPVLEVPVTFVLRENWPLEQRLNRYFSYYLESGILNDDYEASYVNEHRTLDVNENANSEENFKILTASDLGFAFLILGIGLASATIGFLVELCVRKQPPMTLGTQLLVIISSMWTSKMPITNEDSTTLFKTNFPR